MDQLSVSLRTGCNIGCSFVSNCLPDSPQESVRISTCSCCTASFLFLSTVPKSESLLKMYYKKGTLGLHQESAFLQQPANVDIFYFHYEMKCLGIHTKNFMFHLSSNACWWDQGWSKTSALMTAYLGLWQILILSLWLKNILGSHCPAEQPQIEPWEQAYLFSCPWSSLLRRATNRVPTLCYVWGYTIDAVPLWIRAKELRELQCYSSSRFPGFNPCSWQEAICSRCDPPVLASALPPAPTRPVSLGHGAALSSGLAGAKCFPASIPCVSLGRTEHLVGCGYPFAKFGLKWSGVHERTSMCRWIA